MSVTTAVCNNFIQYLVEVLDALPVRPLCVSVDVHLHHASLSETTATKKKSQAAFSRKRDETCFDYRAFDISCRACFDLIPRDIPVFFLQILNESFNHSNIEIVPLSTLVLSASCSIYKASIDTFPGMILQQGAEWLLQPSLQDQVFTTRCFSRTTSLRVATVKAYSQIVPCA